MSNMVLTGILTKLQLTHRMQSVIYALKKSMVSLDEIELP